MGRTWSFLGLGVTDFAEVVEVEVFDLVVDDVFPSDVFSSLSFFDGDGVKKSFFSLFLFTGLRGCLGGTSLTFFFVVVVVVAVCD